MHTTTYFNRTLFSNICPILCSNTRLPIEVNGYTSWRLVISSKKASHVVTCLHCLKCKMPFCDMVWIVIAISICWCHLYTKFREIYTKKDNQERPPNISWVNTTRRHENSNSDKPFSNNSNLAKTRLLQRQCEGKNTVFNSKQINKEIIPKPNKNWSQNKRTEKIRSFRKPLVSNNS